MKTLLVGLAVVAALFLVTPASALEVALEIQPGIGIPLSAFPDGIPVTLEDPEGKYLFEQPNSVYNVLVDLRTNPGFNFGMTLLLNNFSLRAAFAYHEVSSLRLTGIALVRIGGQDLPDIVHNIYPPIFDFPDKYEDMDSTSLVFTRIALGYRWYLADYWVRPYIPMDLGAAMIVVGGDDAYFGLCFRIGLGLEFRVTEFMDIGFSTTYEWMGFALPENFTADAVPAQLATSVSSGNSIMEAFLESLHSLQIGATATFRFF
ncbi:MAG: hypothetical protein V1754_13815 [Pseudomonadota bacterium]